MWVGLLNQGISNVETMNDLVPIECLITDEGNLELSADWCDRIPSCLKYSTGMVPTK
jgi:hypothetical protein